MNREKNRISPQEAVTRFIFSESHYAKTTGRVKYPVFLPKKGETSVFRICKLNDTQIWDIGDNYVAPSSSRTLYARGDIVASDVFDENLTIKPDTRKHKLHANIVGWPLEQAKIKLLTTNLADKAQLCLKP